MSPYTSDSRQKRGGKVSCDLCRRMKIKCDKQGNAECSNCRPRGIACVVTPTVRKSTKAKRAEFLHSIESRIDRMEALLQSSVVAAPPTVEELQKPEPMQSSSPVLVERGLANLIISDSGEQKYIGPCSTFSILSPRGLAWIQRKTGSKRMRFILQKLSRAGPIWTSVRIGHQWDNPNICEFPGRDAAFHLVNHFFQSFNSWFPLFDQKSFWILFEQQYSNNPPAKRSWFGALSVVLSIACIIATEPVYASVLACDHDYFASLSETSWRLFQNACAVLLDIILLDSDLLGVQTVIGMAFIMQTVMNPEGAFVLLGLAARIASSLGLHRHLEGFGLSRTEVEQRQKVFWLMYIMEKDLCNRIGRPSAIDDSDIGFEVPSQDSHHDDEIVISCRSIGIRKFYPFQSMCGLARIQSRIYNKLYSASSRETTPTERLQSISMLDAELAEWKEEFPVEIRPEHPIQCDPESRFPIILLHLGYYHSLTAIHRIHAHHELWESANDEAEVSHNTTSLESSIPPGDAALNSHALCLAAARSILHLSVTYLDTWSDPRNKIILIAPYYPITGFLSLFVHMLNSPLDDRVEADQNLMELSVRCVQQVLGEQNGSMLLVFSDIVVELLMIARQHVAQARAQFSRENNQTTKGNPPDKDPTPSQPQAFSSLNPNPRNDLPQSSFASPEAFRPTVAPGLNPGVPDMINTVNFPSNSSLAGPPGPAFEATSVPAEDFGLNYGEFSDQDFMNDPFLYVQDGEWNWNYLP